MFITSSYSSGCYNRFPLKDTVDTVKSLVKLYGITKSDVDADETEWINLLLPERKDGFELEGIKYYFNDNSLPPEQTFYFNQIQFLSTQAYVLPNDTIKTWRASLPDRTYLLSKISFSCPSRQRVCGLRCCPVTNYIVQELFLDKLGATKKFPDDTVRHGEIVYSLINRNTTCEYTFSYYDTMMRRILDGQEMTVYFDCPTGSSCCGLSCTSPPRMEESRQPHTAGLSLTQIKQVSLGGGCAVFFVLFALVTTANYQMHRRKMIQHPSFRKSESQETQTSRCSLEKEAFVHMEEGR